MTEPETSESPLSRWTALPGDPPDLRHWLAVQRGDPVAEDWPQEETR